MDERIISIHTLNHLYWDLIYRQKSMIPERRNTMLNLKSLKNAMSCVYNNAVNSPLKKDLFHLANALEQCSEKTGDRKSVV